ncbi:MAG: hypothetical protein JWO48_2659 [Bryobacterales bacterium]|nr:hypothetical protein [Bryobacterales bacterium]
MKREDSRPIGTKCHEPNQNNVWFQRNDSDTIFVFVHGIFSDSRGCWLAVDPEDQKQSTYWPELLINDQHFNRPSVFLGGYATSIDSGPYDVRQAARELGDALKRKGVLEKQRIIFIGHSTGGIVIRFLIVHNQELLRNKIIGVALYASPSIGSEWARTLGSLSDFYGNALAQQLRPDNTTLRELDKDFRELLYNPNSNPQNVKIVGVEAVENFLIIHRRFLPDKRLVVPEESASRYFGAPRYLPRTDHFTAVKPTSGDQPAHELLISFYDKMEKDYPRTRASDDSVGQPKRQFPRWSLSGDQRIDDVLRSLNKPSQRSGDKELWTILRPLFSRDAFNHCIQEGDWVRALFVYAKTRQITSSYWQHLDDAATRQRLQTIDTILQDLHNRIAVKYKEADPDFNPDSHSEATLHSKQLFIDTLPKYRTGAHEVLEPEWAPRILSIEQLMAEQDKTLGLRRSDTPCVSVTNNP